MMSLWLMSARPCGLGFVALCHAPRCVDSRSQIIAAQGGQEADERGRLGGTKRFAVSRHVASTLQDLANNLVFGHVRCDRVECGAAKPTCSADRVAVAALLVLQDNRSLPLQRSSVF